MVEQRTSYAVSDFRKLIGKHANPINGPSELLRESSAKSLIFACVPGFGLLDVRLGKIPDNNGDHSSPGVPFRRSARTFCHGRLAFGLA